ncbi:MAG: ribose-5-phosphate isomerase RpiA [Pseudomonadota bacterium]
MPSDRAKKAAAIKALDLVQPEMTLGLGTGSTAALFIRALGERARDGLYVRGVPTSRESERLALEYGIDLVTPNETTQIDLAIDGADEVNPQGALIKGGGAALLREKIIADAALKFVVIADASKLVTTLGAFALPVEIEPFGWALSVQAVRKTLADLGFSGANVSLRGDERGILHTDGGHYILDCTLGRIEAPASLDTKLKAIPGVIETGLFVDQPDLIILGKDDGSVDVTIPA